jgi:hypothetical protein
MEPLLLAGRWLTLSSARRQSEAETKQRHEVTIGTHGGLFHCDEVLACYMLKVLPEYKNARYCTCMYQGQIQNFERGGANRAQIFDHAPFLETTPT